MGRFSGFLRKLSPRKKSYGKARSVPNLEIAVANEESFALEKGSATLKLGKVGLKFDDGTWQTQELSDENEYLRLENDRLVEENNMLTLKLAILLDMLSETTAESHILEKERDEALRAVQKANKQK